MTKDIAGQQLLMEKLAKKLKITKILFKREHFLFPFLLFVYLYIFISVKRSKNTPSLYGSNRSKLNFY